MAIVATPFREVEHARATVDLVQAEVNSNRVSEALTGVFVGRLTKKGKREVFHAKVFGDSLDAVDGAFSDFPLGVGVLVAVSATMTSLEWSLRHLEYRGEPATRFVDVDGDQLVRLCSNKLLGMSATNLTQEKKNSPTLYN